MTSKTSVFRAVSDTLEWFPDFPPREDMQNPLHLSKPAIIAALDFHFEGSETTLVLGEVPVAMNVQQTRAGVRIPDLIIAFDVDVPAIIERNGYAINLVGKPPDFVLEVASPTTGRRDYTDKRRDYERFGIPEYWRFDGTGGDYHDAPLAGDRLVDGRYQPHRGRVAVTGHGAWLQRSVGAVPVLGRGLPALLRPEGGRIPAHLSRND